MAYEATLMIETARPISFTCSNTVGIEKGAALKLSDPMTVSAVTADHDYIGGIAAEEKIASDGKTKIAVYREGVFKVHISSAVTAGDPVTVEGDTPNTFKTARNTPDLDLSGARIWGIALETAAALETALIELRPMAHGAD